MAYIHPLGSMQQRMVSASTLGLCLTVLFILRLFYNSLSYINVYALFINYIIGCNKTNARRTGEYKKLDHDRSIKFLYGSTGIND